MPLQVAQRSGASGSGPSLTLNFGSPGYKDYLIAAVAGEANTWPAEPSGEGWTLIGRQRDNFAGGYYCTAAVYIKQWGVGDTDDATPTFTNFTVSAQPRVTGRAIRVEGASGYASAHTSASDKTTPFAINAAQADAGAVWPTLLCVVAGSCCIWSSTLRQQPEHSSGPTGFTIYETSLQQTSSIDGVDTLTNEQYCNPDSMEWVNNYPSTPLNPTDSAMNIATFVFWEEEPAMGGFGPIPIY